MTVNANIVSHTNLAVLFRREIVDPRKAVGVYRLPYLEALSEVMSTTSGEPLEVIIVGGSLAGLFTGITLKRLGHHVQILERSPVALLHDQGAGIVAGDETQQFFQRHDRTHTPIAVTSPLRHYLDRDGLEIDVEHWEQRMTSWDLLWNLSRANFDGECGKGYVSDSVMEDVRRKNQADGQAVYDHGCRVTGIRARPGGKGVEVSYTDVISGKGTNGVAKDDHARTANADLVIAADGASSVVRSLFEPHTQRTYAGYVVWRGTCPESELSQAASDTLVEKFTFFHSKGLQILAYIIPGKHGTLERGKRLMNWAWYCNHAKDSEGLKELMTDSDGRQHHVTLPMGKIQDHVWENQKILARQILPPQFDEIVRKTKQPFVQAITDVVSERISFLDGKVLCVGNAVAEFRPHTAAGARQAALDAFTVEELFKGQASIQEWEEKTMTFAKETQRRGVKMGERSQFGDHPLAR